MPAPGAITQLLQRVAAGDTRADADLLPLIYDELRRIAAHHLARERAGHTLSPTALVHEAWMRLAGDASFAPEDRRQFYAVAARRMRQVLVDHARQRDSAKRGGGQSPVTLDGLADERSGVSVDVLALDQALEQLDALDPRRTRVVELRYFAGLEMGEIAEVLGISRATAQRDWDVARAFLFDALNG